MPISLSKPNFPLNIRLSHNEPERRAKSSDNLYILLMHTTKLITHVSCSFVPQNPQVALADSYRATSLMAGVWKITEDGTKCPDCKVACGEHVREP